MFKPYPYQQELIDKARISLSKGNKSVLIVSPAGSGKSVIIAEISRLAIDKGGHVMFMVHRKELVEQIKETFIKNEIDLSHTTIMTVGRIKNRLGKLKKPTLIITDETHHSLAKTYRTIYEYYHDVPRIGFSATPWRLSGKGLKDVYENMVVGPQVQWLIDHHYLAPFKMYGFQCDTSDLKRSSTGDFTKRSMDEMAKKTIHGDIVNNWKKLANGKKTIIYCHAIWFSKQVAEWFNQAGISAAHADSKTPAKERDAIMEKFRQGKIKILCNVDLVSEGFNVPDCSCVIMLRPTESLVLYIQQSMRSMRYVKGKEAVIIDQVENYKRFGLPNADRQWSLEDREKKGKKKQESDAPAIRTCDECFAVIPSESKVCPVCGAEIKIEKEKVDIDENAKLEEINTFKLTVNSLATKKPSELNSVAELKEYAKIKGYKPGWVYFQQKQRGWIK